MTGGFVLVSNGVSSHVIPERFFLPCQVAYGKTFLPSMTFARGQELFLGPNSSIASYSKSLPLICKASSSRPNEHFSRIYKGSPRGINWQNYEREKPVNLDANLLSFNNGPYVSSTSKRRPSTTATPEQRKEIIELFRKVQAQLRERYTRRKETKYEGAQQGQRDKVGGGSFFKLQSLNHWRNRGSEDGYTIDQPSKFDSFDHQEQSEPFEMEQNSSFFEYNNLYTDNGFREPKQSFKRKLPVTKVKYQAVLSAREDKDGEPPLNLNQKPKPDIEPPVGHLREDHHDRTTFESFSNHWVVTSHPSDSFDADETNKEISESFLERGSDMNTMTMAELKSLAKSRGLRGYSKLNRSMLLELLNAPVGSS